MKKSLYLTIAISSILMGSDTTFESLDKEKFIKTNEYGEAVYEKTFKLQTSGVETTHMFADKKSSDTVSMQGTVEITVAPSSLCTLYPNELDAKGCSGQKPFFINKNALNPAINPLNDDGTFSLVFHKDYEATYDDNGNFVSGANVYAPNSGQYFYPLDVDRDEKYYKAVTSSGEESRHYSFMGKMFKFFYNEDNFFAKLFSRDTTVRDTHLEDDVHKRYMANMLSGYDQEHRLKIGDSVDTNTFNTHNPASLVEYTQAIIEEDDTSCGSQTKMPMFQMMSKMMCMMPVMNWFVPKTTQKGRSYIIDTIEQDTESALIASAGMISGVDMKTYKDNSYDTSDLDTHYTGPFNFFKNIKCSFFADCTQKGYLPTTLKERYRQYPEESAMTMSMPVVNGSGVITDVVPLKVLGIHSIEAQQEGCVIFEREQGLFAQIFDAFNWDDLENLTTEIKPHVMVNQGQLYSYEPAGSKLIPLNMMMRMMNMMSMGLFDAVTEGWKKKDTVENEGDTYSYCKKKVGKFCISYGTATVKGNFDYWSAMCKDPTQAGDIVESWNSGLFGGKKHEYVILEKVKTSASGIVLDVKEYDSSAELNLENSTIVDVKTKSVK